MDNTCPMYHGSSSFSVEFVKEKIGSFYKWRTPFQDFCTDERDSSMSPIITLQMIIVLLHWFNCWYIGGRGGGDIDFSAENSTGYSNKEFSILHNFVVKLVLVCILKTCPLFKCWKLLTHHYWFQPNQMLETWLLFYFSVNKQNISLKPKQKGTKLVLSKIWTKEQKIKFKKGWK